MEFIRTGIGSTNISVIKKQVKCKSLNSPAGNGQDRESGVSLITLFKWQNGYKSQPEANYHVNSAKYRFIFKESNAWIQLFIFTGVE